MDNLSYEKYYDFCVAVQLDVLLTREGCD